MKTISFGEGKQWPKEEEYISDLFLPSPNDHKLVDAFNHRRKLCGAPEPIKF